MLATSTDQSTDSDQSTTDSSTESTTVDWGELISAVVGEIERQYGTTTQMSTQDSDSTTTEAIVTAMEWTDSSTNGTTRRRRRSTTTTSATTSTESWDEWMNQWMSSTGTSVTEQDINKTTMDVQSCIDSIMQIVSDLNNQLPGNRGEQSSTTTTSSTTTGSSSTSTQDMMSDVMENILSQFG